MDFYDKIEDYINQTLTDDERQAFDTALVSDIRLQRSVVEQRILFDAMRRDRLKSKIERIVDKLPKPETPVVNIKTVKKNNYWWAAAAAVLLIGVGIWWSQNSMIRSRYRMAQKQPPTTPTDTMIKNEVKTPQNIATVEPKQTPQYPTTKKVEKPIQQGNAHPKEPNSKAETDRFIGV